MAFFTSKDLKNWEFQSELLDIDAEFEIKEAESFGFVINGLPISYNKNENLLSCGEETAYLKSVDSRIKLRILVDRVSVEIYANDGRLYMPIRNSELFTPTKDYFKDEEKGLSIFTKGGDTKIHSLKVHELKSIWKTKTEK
jgi:sucrose-6-phosphate hydrolase SacC (GH32 family)